MATENLLDTGVESPRYPPLPARSSSAMTIEGLLGEAIAITGNAKALLRAQIDRALKNEAEEGDAWSGKG